MLNKKSGGVIPNIPFGNVVLQSQFSNQLTIVDWDTTVGMTLADRTDYASYDTSQSVFGLPASAKIDSQTNSLSYIRTGTRPSLGTNPFLIELILRITSIGASGTHFYSASNYLSTLISGFHIGNVNDANPTTFRASFYNGTTVEASPIGSCVFADSGDPLPLNTWLYLATYRVGDNLYVKIGEIGGGVTTRHYSGTFNPGASVNPSSNTFTALGMKIWNIITTRGTTANYQGIRVATNLSSNLPDDVNTPLVVPTAPWPTS
jgi:hypothetical protein